MNRAALLFSFVVAVDALTKFFLPTVESTDLAFGLGDPTPNQAVVASLLGLVVVLRLVRPWWICGLMAGAVMGNFVDRVMLNGAVRDITLPWLYVNFADLAFVAAGLWWALSGKGVTDEQDQARVQAQ